MKLKKKLAYISFIFMVLMCFIVNMVFGMENYSIFDKIINKTNSQVIETGMTVYYSTKNEGEAECINWLKSMNLYEKEIGIKLNVKNEDLKNDQLKSAVDVNLFKLNKLDNIYKIKNNITLEDNKVYCREFESGAIYGYIECRKEMSNTDISIFIRKISAQNEIDNLYNKVRHAMGKGAENIVVNKYIKCKDKVQGIESIQKNIQKLLVSSGAENIKEVTINSGYSTVAYLKQNTPINDNGKLIDLNYAVLKGYGENYIIIATPIIDITY